MSISLSLEIEEGLTEDELLRAARACGAVVPSEEHPSGTLAIFPDSGLDVFVHTLSGSRAVVTEGLGTPFPWRVGMRVSLGFLLEKYDECNRDVHRLLEKLASQSPSSFILSFQNETVHAVRDEKGLRFVSEVAAS